MRATQLITGAAALLLACSAARAEDLVWVQEAKFLAGDGHAGDLLGHAVDMDGDRVVISVPYNGDYGQWSGCVYVFKLENELWIEEAKLIGSDTWFHDKFGMSVAIEGDTIVVGATGVDDHGYRAGAVYVFQHDGESWLQEATLLPTDVAAEDYLGQAVAISGDWIVAGAAGDDDNGDSAGAAYVFHHDGQCWEEHAKLLTSDGAALDHFGLSLAMGVDIVAISAVGDDDHGADSGSVYIYRYDGASWVVDAKITNSDGSRMDWFGWALDLCGDAIIVGVDLDDDYGQSSGSAYVFRHDGAAWIEEAKLIPSDSAYKDHFGHAVSIDNQLAVVGAYMDDDSGDESGSAYVFEYVGGTWMETAKLLPDDGDIEDWFGYSVSLRSNRAVVTTPCDDDNGGNSGSAYVFRARPPCVGDINDDWERGQPDLGILLASYELPQDDPLYDPRADLDGDGDVDAEDLSALLAVYDVPCD
ncbi:MAG: FG-GAP repeat protein [Phycisphaerales bacterium JB038]